MSIVNNGLIIQYGHYQQPAGVVVTQFPITFSQTFTIVSCRVGQDARVMDQAPMIYAIAITGFQSYYKDNYYGTTDGNFKSGLHWLVIGT